MADHRLFFRGQRVAISIREADDRLVLEYGEFFGQGAGES
jgi:hypothetical protein